MYIYNILESIYSSRKDVREEEESMMENTKRKRFIFTVNQATDLGFVVSLQEETSLLKRAGIKFAGED